MALLGMDTNVQCNGYFPGYHSMKDLSFGTEGCAWTACYGNSDLKNDCYHNGPLPAPSPGDLLGYNRELLKQTILKHEAIFRDQIHELHRLYLKQKELMEETKMKELYAYNLRLDTSWPSSTFSCISSQNAQKICCSSNFPWSTGQSSFSISKSVQLPVGFVQVKSRPVCPVPAPTEEYSKDSKLLESKFMKVGKKILDLELPADEYIDSEECELFRGQTESEVAGVATYTLNGISQVMCNSDQKASLGCNGTTSDGFTDLNEPLKLKEEPAVKSDNLTRPMAPICHRDNCFYDLPRRKEFGFDNSLNDATLNSRRKMDLEACTEQEKKYELLSSTHAGQSGSVFDSSDKVIDKGKLSVEYKPFITEQEQVYGIPYFHSLDQINQGSASDGLLRPNSPSRTCTPYGLVSKGDTINSGISSALLCEKSVCDLGQGPIGVPALPYFSTSAPSGQSSQSLMGIPGFTGDKFHQCKSIKSGSKTSDSPLISSTNYLNSCDNHGSSAVCGLEKYVKGSEDGAGSKSINLNIMPVGYSDITAFESIQSMDEGKEFQDSRCRLPWLKEEPPVPKGKPNEETIMSAQMESSLCQPYNYVIDLGRQVPPGENIMKNELEKKHKGLAGLIDLNSCVNEDENMPINIDSRGPVSPENKECSPPRGESDEIQPEMPYQLTGQEGPEAWEEQARMAAEALVSISAFVASNGLQLTNSPPSESFASSPLQWFAGIVTSVTNHLENEVKLDFSGNTDDLEECLPPGIDYFEAMTLKLSETKVLDCSCKSSGQNLGEGGFTSPTQPKKGKTNRGRQRKDFQSDILPSLASLSRYEVTEDLQTIGGLMEAVGTRLEMGYLRNAGRNALARGRKRSCTASNTSGLPLKQLTSSRSELGIEKKGLKSWGKTSKKRRGKRYPAKNLQFISSQAGK